jgi:hypothetical protein
MILRDDFALHASILDLKATLMSLGFSNTVIKGIKMDFEITSLQFDPKWLQAVEAITTKDWCSLHHHLSASARELNKYDIMMWLSTMAYATSANMDVVQALSIFYRMYGMAKANIPSFSEVRLFLGDSWSESQLIKCIDIATKDISLCPEGLIKRGHGESKAKHAQRTSIPYRNNQSAAILDFVRSLENQWPNQYPSTPSSAAINTYLNTSVAMTHVRNCYKKWRQNGAFFKYLRDLSTLLRDQVSIPISPRPLVFVRPVVQNELSASARYVGTTTMLTVPAPMFLGGGLFIAEGGIVDLTRS